MQRIPGKHTGGRSAVCAIAVLLAVGSASAAQAQTVFRSTQSANLPTATLLDEGRWMFEISHRFDNAIANGADAFWGLDGPVVNRLGLAYAPHSRLMLGVQRSNRYDNVELYGRFRGFTLGSDEEETEVPVEVAAQGGIAWNTQLPEGEPDFVNKEMQAYVQVIGNALILDRFALGVVPTVLRNPRLADEDSETAFVLGLNGQLYFADGWSVLGEWVVSDEREDQEFDSFAAGLEIRTRGHVFKVVVTNQVLMNPTHVMGGSRLDPGDTGEWRLGFNIQRMLAF